MSFFAFEKRKAIPVRAARNSTAYGQIPVLANNIINDDPARVFGPERMRDRRLYVNMRCLHTDFFSRLFDLR